MQPIKLPVAYPIVRKTNKRSKNISVLKSSFSEESSDDELFKRSKIIRLPVGKQKPGESISEIRLQKEPDVGGGISRGLIPITQLPVGQEILQKYSSTQVPHCVNLAFDTNNSRKIADESTASSRDVKSGCKSLPSDLLSVSQSVGTQTLDDISVCEEFSINLSLEPENKRSEKGVLSYVETDEPQKSRALFDTRSSGHTNSSTRTDVMKRKRPLPKQRCVDYRTPPQRCQDSRLSNPINSWREAKNFACFGIEKENRSPKVKAPSCKRTMEPLKCRDSLDPRSSNKQNIPIRVDITRRKRPLSKEKHNCCSRESHGEADKFKDLGTPTDASSSDITLQNEILLGKAISTARGKSRFRFMDDFPLPHYRNIRKSRLTRPTMDSYRPLLEMKSSSRCLLESQRGSPCSDEWPTYRQLLDVYRTSSPKRNKRALATLNGWPSHQSNQSLSAQNCNQKYTALNNCSPTQPTIQFWMTDLPDIGSFSTIQTAPNHSNPQSSLEVSQLPNQMPVSIGGSINNSARTYNVSQNYPMFNNHEFRSRESSARGKSVIQSEIDAYSSYSVSGPIPNVHSLTTASIANEGICQTMFGPNDHLQRSVSQSGRVPNVQSPMTGQQELYLQRKNQSGAGSVIPCQGVLFNLEGEQIPLGSSVLVSRPTLTSPDKNSVDLIATRTNCCMPAVQPEMSVIGESSLDNATYFMPSSVCQQMVCLPSSGVTPNCVSILKTPYIPLLQYNDFLPRGDQVILDTTDSLRKGRVSHLNDRVESPARPNIEEYTTLSNRFVSAMLPHEGQSEDIRENTLSWSHLVTPIYPPTLLGLYQLQSDKSVKNKLRQNALFREGRHSCKFTQTVKKGGESSFIARRLSATSLTAGTPQIQKVSVKASSCPSGEVEKQ